MMAVQREGSELVSLVYACGSDHTSGLDVYWFCVAGVFDDFGHDAAKRNGERSQLLVGTVEKFFFVDR